MRLHGVGCSNARRRSGKASKPCVGPSQWARARFEASASLLKHARPRGSSAREGAKGDIGLFQGVRPSPNNWNITRFALIALAAHCLDAPSPYALPHPRLVSARELDALPAYPKLLAVAELDEITRRLGIVLEHARELTIQMRRCGRLQARDDADALHGQHRRADGQRDCISRAELDAVQLRGFVKLKDGRARAVVSAVLAHEPFNAHLMREAISMHSACNQHAISPRALLSLPRASGAD